MSLENPFSRLVIGPEAALTVGLAVLQPSDIPASPIRVKLISANPKETSFEVISYERPRNAGTGYVSILIDDQDFEIPAALADALRTFRRKENPRTLWADVLIGRTQQERAGQTAVLKTVLENAEKTLCWLGKDTPRVTARAFTILGDIANQWYQACLAVHVPPESSMIYMSREKLAAIKVCLLTANFGDLDSIDTERWIEMEKILGSTYWSSVQCFPEIVLAKKAIIVSGRSNIGWARYVNAAAMFPIVRNRFLPVTIPPSVTHASECAMAADNAFRRRTLGQSNELHAMIPNARLWGAQDPRDYVFSIIPICTSSGRVAAHRAGSQLLPKVDYTKTPTQVFIEAARHIILERQDLLIWFAERAPCVKRTKDLPTWVPDFAHGIPKLASADPNRGLRFWWETVKPRKEIRITDDGTNALLVQAHTIGRVEHVSQLFDAGTWAKVVYREYMNLPDPIPGETIERRDERFWRALILDSGGYQGETTSPSGAAAGDSFKCIMAIEAMYDRLGIAPWQSRQFSAGQLEARVRTEMPDLVPYLPRQGTTIWPQQFALLIEKFSFGRRFFRTECGRFGMTAVEDVTCIDATLFQEERRARGIDPDRDGGYLTRMSLDHLESEIPQPTFPLDQTMPNFRGFLQERNPVAAENYARAFRGDMPEQKEKLAETDATGGVEKGDHIVALVGGFRPYILRSHPGSADEKKGDDDPATSSQDSIAPNNRYQFVGDCYLHGSMDGWDFSVERLEQINADTEGWAEGSVDFGGRHHRFRTDMSKVVDIRIV